MELKDFVKKVLIDLVQGVEEARSEAVRDMKLFDKEGRTVEFDIAVTVEDVNKNSGKAGIRVLQFIEGDADVAKETRNSTVSRVKFGILVGGLTKDEDARRAAEAKARGNQNREERPW